MMVRKKIELVARRVGIFRAGSAWLSLGKGRKEWVKLIISRQLSLQGRVSLTILWDFKRNASNH